MRAALAQAAVGALAGAGALGGGSLELRWNAGEAIGRRRSRALAQALDNLIVNAIEHGGPTIVVAGRSREGRLRIAVVDSGRASRPRSRRNSPAEVIAAPLRPAAAAATASRVVRRVAAAHGGRFALRRAERGSLAVLELPLADDERRPGGMSRRARAVAFLALALLAAALAAAIADGYGSRVARGYGPLRPVVVARRASLRRRAGRSGREEVAGGAGGAPGAGPLRPAGRAARSRATRSAWRRPRRSPPGSYLLAAQLRPPRRRERGGRRCSGRPPPGRDLGQRRRALLAAGAAAPRREGRRRRHHRTERAGSGPHLRGRGRRCRCWRSGPGADGPGPGGTSAATLALTRRQALRLIAAESFARKLTLLPEG